MRRRLLHPAVRRAIPHGRVRRVDRRRAERNLLRIRRLSSSGGFIPTSRESVGSSHLPDYSIRTLPLTDSSSNSCGSYSSSSSVASPQQQIIQRKRIHLPQNPPAGYSTGPVYANQSIASGPSNPLSNSVRLTGSPRNSPASSNSIGSSSFYSRKLSRRPSSWPPTASSSSFPCPTCWPVSAKVSQRPAQTDEPEPGTSPSSWLPSSTSSKSKAEARPAPVPDLYVASSSSPAGPRGNQQQQTAFSSSAGSSSTTRPCPKSFTSSSD